MVLYARAIALSRRRVLKLNNYKALKNNCVKNISKGLNRV